MCGGGFEAVAPRQGTAVRSQVALLVVFAGPARKRPASSIAGIDPNSWDAKIAEMPLIFLPREILVRRSLMSATWAKMLTRRCARRRRSKVAFGEVRPAAIFV